GKWVECRVEEPEAPAPGAEPNAPERARTSSCSDRRRCPSTISFDCPEVRPRSCAWSCSSSNWRDGWNATGAPWCRCCKRSRPRKFQLRVLQSSVAAAFNSEVAVRLAVFVDADRHRIRRESHGSQRCHHGDVPDDPHSPSPDRNPRAAGSTPELSAPRAVELGLVLPVHAEILRV